MGRRVPTYDGHLLGSAFGVGLAQLLLAVLLVGSSAATTSDDFSAASGVLGPEWSVVDPLGGATVQIVGTGTGDAQLSISVPAGTAHDAWTNGPEVPRVVQSVPNTDFEVEVKFESSVGVTYQTEGLIFEDGSGDFLRFDVYGRNGSTYLFAATVFGGSATTHVKRRIATSPAEPIYLRVSRVGDTWTLRQSWDGTAWSAGESFVQPFALSSVGIYAGNSGTNPAHTVLVDYLFDTSNPINPEDGQVGGCDYVLAANVSGGGTIQLDPSSSCYGAGEVVSLTAVPAADHTFGGWSGDAGGSANPLQLTMNGDKIITATFVVDDSPPVISNVQVLPLTNSARILWETDEPATSRIDYGPSAAYEDGFVTDTGLDTSHEILLTGLIPDSTVHYRIRSEPAAIPKPRSGIRFPNGETALCRAIAK
jgi:hypothetical protein